MSGTEAHGRPQPAANGSAEVYLTGRSVSRGIAIGKVLCLYGNIRQFYRKEISEGEISAEVERFHRAVRVAVEQLAAIAKAEPTPTAAAGILDAQRLMLEDQSFLSDITRVIESKHVNSEWAVKEVSGNFIARYKSLADERIRERYIDIEDVTERIVAALGGTVADAAADGSGSIIVAHELRPSTLAEFTVRPPAAVITEHGGWTSHTFILTRELELPAVTGIRRLLRKLKTGDTIVVDGNNGLVVLHPTPETLEKYKSHKLVHHDVGSARAGTNECCSTLDGREITIRANLDIPSVYEKAASLGAKGVGLYRSEYLFNQFRDFPSEDEQYTAYSAIGDFAGSDGVKIRTFDIGATQLVAGNQVREKNPALGLRAIRLSMSQPQQFRTQIRALLRASAGRNIDIIVPMVSGPSEMRWARGILADEGERLDKGDIEIGNPRLGGMVEVPSAVLMIDEVLEESDFISLGTNDLVQYLVAADRDNETVTDWFRTLHPAVIRAVDKVISACRAAAKQLVICGEMAGSPFYLPVLLGLGATELSMSINSIVRARKVIAGIAFEEATLLAGKMKRCSTAEEAETLLSEQINKHWAHLFPPPAGERLAR